MAAWVLCRALRAGLASTILLVSACAPPSPGSQKAVVNALDEQLRFQYHDCVPLGWQPVAIAGTYFPGYIASLQTYEEFLDAVWRGHIATGELSKPAPRAVFTLLNHLVDKGLVTREETVSGYDFLTPGAMKYYYASSSYGNNNIDLQYLCYSTIVPDSIVWMERIKNPDPESPRTSQWYRVEFRWKSSAPERWSNDPYLQSHSIVLPPIHNPISARMIFYKDQWHLVNMYDRTWGLPILRSAHR